MVKTCVQCNGTCKQFCAQCQKQCRKRHCPCDNVFYCDTICQNLHWATHKSACSRVCEHVAVSAFVLSTEQMEVLYKPLADDAHNRPYIKRTINLCNQRPVSISIPKTLGGGPFISSKISMKGTGNIATFDPATREVIIFRGNVDLHGAIMSELTRVGGTPNLEVQALILSAGVTECRFPAP
jgi:hypothetical protein